ncbi:high-potential iron-sulfur protein [Bdellovibrionota bacterium FG-1]
MQTRRSFFKSSLTILGSLALAPWLRGRAGLALAASAKPLVAETDAVAQALGYHKDAKKVDSKKWPNHAGPEGAKKNCSTCMFFTAIDKTQGNCQIFPNNTVLAKSWCNSWQPKPPTA